MSEITADAPHALDITHEYTSIRVHKSTIKKLDRLGKFKESYGELVDRIASRALGLTSGPNTSDGGSF